MKNLVFRTSDNVIRSYSVESLVAIKVLTSGAGIVSFLFNSDDNTEIYSLGVTVSAGKELDFLRDIQDNLSYSKQDSIVVADDADKYVISNNMISSAFLYTAIPSPVFLNGDLDLTSGDNPFDISAGNITAVSALSSDGDVVFGGSIVDSSTPPPTASSTGSSVMTVNGKDSVGKVTFTFADGVNGDVVTVTYGTSSTNTRVPVVSPIAIDVELTSYDNDEFTVRVGSSGVTAGGAFTYITQDYA